MFLSGLTDGGATPALIATLTYNETRLRMLSENIANVHTPGYRAKHLDTRAFQRSLRVALDERRGGGSRPFRVEVPGEVETDRFGRLKVTPSERPTENILFHDGTNLSIERQMADLAETGMTHELATEFLRGRFQGLRKAIRGTV